jgi:Ca2+-binding RTX toxin-like protein
VSNIEGITLSDADTAANFSVTLDNAMFTHSANHLIIVGPTSAMTGNTVIDASAVTDASAELYVDAGTGNDVYKGTAGDDYFVFGIDNTGHATLNAQDVLAGGGGGHDELQIGSGTYVGTVTLSDSDISHMSGIELLYLSGAQGLHWNVTLDQAFQAEGVSEVDFASAADTLHFDATAYTEDLLVHAGDSDGVFLLGAGNDTIEFEKGPFADAQLTGTTAVNGGGGHNSLLFVGSATVTDADFAQVSKVQEIDVQASKISLTLGTNSDAAGIVTVDASHAGAAATIDGTASHQNLTLHGSALADILEGGTGADLIAGGSGGDILLGGAGNNVFYYASAADSHQEAGNNLSLADIIGDFHSGDTINIDSLVGGISGVTNQGTVASFPTTDVAGFYGNNQVAVEFDGANTRVFVDANHDGNFNLNQDVVIQVIGNHLAALADTASYN